MGTTPSTEFTEDNSLLKQDVGFIIALSCFGVGGLLLLAGFCRLIVWYLQVRKQEKSEERQIRQWQNIRYIEDYSIKTGGSPEEFLIRNGTGKIEHDGEVLNWDKVGSNKGFVIEDSGGQSIPASLTSSTTNFPLPKPNEEPPEPEEGADVQF